MKKPSFKNLKTKELSVSDLNRSKGGYVIALTWTTVKVFGNERQKREIKHIENMICDVAIDIGTMTWEGMNDFGKGVEKEANNAWNTIKGWF